MVASLMKCCGWCKKNQTKQKQNKKPLKLKKAALTFYPAGKRKQKFLYTWSFFARFERPFHTPVTAENKKSVLFWLLSSSLETYIDFKPEKVGKVQVQRSKGTHQKSSLSPPQYSLFFTQFHSRIFFLLLNM